MNNELIHTEQLLDYRPRTCVSFILNGKLISLPFEEIIRARTWFAGTIIFTPLRSYRCYLTIEELERTLPLNDFFKVNAGHILAIRHISGWKDKKALIGNRQFSVTKIKRLELIKVLERIMETHYDSFYEKRV